MKTVITYGTFDLFHVGHIKLLRRARELGDKLIVALSTDEFNLNSKNKITAIPYTDRKLILESLRFVDMVIPENCWEQKRLDIVNHKVSIFVMGDDWEGKFNCLSDICEVRYFPRTLNISSTQIKEHLREGNTTRLIAAAS